MEWNRLDVMQVLIEHGADLEIEDRVLGAPIFVAADSFNTAAVKLLLEHGADVNRRRQTRGLTVLFVAILSKQHKLVKLLLSYGADVNVFADYTGNARHHYRTYGCSPLHAALRSFEYRPARYMYFAARILKLIVPRCDSFDLIINDVDGDGSTYRREPCVVHFFRAERELRWDDDFTTTKYLLCNGAVAKFSQFYDFFVKYRLPFKHALTTDLLQLILLAGCKFDTHFTEETNTRQWSIEERLWYDEHVQPVLDKVNDLLAQPLTLQELSIMVIRRCIGSRQLWAKIDSLPLPALVKDNIKLKTYIPDTNSGPYADTDEPSSWHLERWSGFTYLEMSRFRDGYN